MKMKNLPLAFAACLVLMVSFASRAVARGVKTSDTAQITCRHDRGNLKGINPGLKQLTAQVKSTNNKNGQRGI